MSGKSRQSLLHGAVILMSATVIVKLIGVLFRIPLTAIIGVAGMGYFNVAYSLFGTLYALSVAGLPVAVSRLVAESLARGRLRDLRKIKRISTAAYLIAGVAGSLVMYFGAEPYAQLTHNPGAALPIRVMAPAVLFVCLIASYRGYYEGFQNMYPTAISQVVEAVFKLLIGLGLAKWMLGRCMTEFAQRGTVFGQPVEGLERAGLAALPYASAAAIAGMVASTAAGFLFLWIRHHMVGEGISQAQLSAAPKASSSGELLKRIAVVAFPVCMAALAMNITTLIDTVSITERISAALEEGAQMILHQYAGSIPEALTLAELPNYLFGAYSLALSVYHLVPAFTATFGVSALPTVTTAWTMGNRPALKRNIESVLRVTAMIAVPAGLGISALAKPILLLLYPSQAESVAIATPILQVLGVAVVFVAATSPVNSMLQAIGRMDLPVKLMLLGAGIKLTVNYLFIADPHYNIQAVPYGTLLCYLVIAIWEVAALCRETAISLDVTGVFGKPLLAGIVCAVSARVVYSALTLWMDGMLPLFLSIAAAAVIYSIFLILLHAIVRQDVLMLPKGEKIAKRLEKYGVIR